MNKKSLLLLISGLALSACGNGYSSYQNGFYSYHDVDRSIPVKSMAYNVSLSDVREVYKDSNVEIFDLNQYPSIYTSQRHYARPPLGYALNNRIPVKDKSVEIYDIGFPQASANLAPPRNIMAQGGSRLSVPLSPPSSVKENFQSPFLVIEEDGMLTDPFVDNSHTSVIVSPTENQSQEDGIELMTGF